MKIGLIVSPLLSSWKVFFKIINMEYMRITDLIYFN